jgi:hypothetical protein
MMAHGRHVCRIRADRFRERNSAGLDQARRAGRGLVVAVLLKKGATAAIAPSELWERKGRRRCPPVPGAASGNDFTIGSSGPELKLLKKAPVSKPSLG